GVERSAGRAVGGSRPRGGRDPRGRAGDRGRRARLRRRRMSDLEGIRPPGRVTRIGRRPNPWAWPPWEAQHSDATFGNRWDDPEGIYRVLYAATQLRGADVEVVPRFRPDPVVVAELGKIDGAEDQHRIGIVPAEWLTTRAIRH